MEGFDIGLRLIGLFYIAAGIVAARQMLLNDILDKALSGLTMEPVPRAEALRARWLMGGALSVFLGGTLLAVLSVLALPAFLIAAAGQALYLGHVAPRFLDPGDPPDADGRRSTANAFRLYLAATALVALGAAAGRLRWPQDEPWPLAGALIAAALFSGYHIHQLCRPLGGRPEPADQPLDGSDDAPLPQRIRLQIRPPLLPFADDETGRVVPQALAVRTFGEELVGDILDWETNYLGTIPQGKRRGGFTDPETAGYHEAEGRALAARMADAIGAARVVYAPVGTPFARAPERLRTDPARIKVMADYGCHPLWSLDDDYGEIDPEVLGLSAALVADLGAWAERFEDALDWDDAGAPKEDDGFLAGHEAEGRRLAVRLARELRDQGRGHVMVYAMTRAAGVVEVRADDPL